MVLVIGTISMWRQYFNRNVGMGSSYEDLLENDKISLATSVSEVGLKNEEGCCTIGKSILQLEARPGKEVC